MGYKYLRKKDYEKAIDVFKINAELHPNSANVYDSLAEAYLLNDDSLQAYNNYNVALSFNNEIRKAEVFVNANASKYKN
ncbi:hypothetical protein [Winogradskyella sp. PC D3.3]